MTFLQMMQDPYFAAGVGCMVFGVALGVVVILLRGGR